MSIVIDLTGKQFGDLTVLELTFDVPGKKKKWLCQCKCGNQAIISASNLKSGHTKHCIKCGHKVVADKRSTHRVGNSRMYGAWSAIQTRCSNPNSKSYHDYGERGISVCSEWKSFENFYQWAIANGYKEGLEIDRINVNGNYTPDNCRWVSRIENANNKRNNKLIIYHGEAKTLVQWARFFNVNYKNLSRNIIKGYSLEDAVQRIRTGERTHKGSKAWLENREGYAMC